MAWIASSGLITGADAKPIHLAELKDELIRRNIQCTTCHINPENTDLTAYGRSITSLGNAESVPARGCPILRVSEGWGTDG